MQNDIHLTQINLINEHYMDVNLAFHQSKSTLFIIKHKHTQFAHNQNALDWNIITEIPVNHQSAYAKSDKNRNTEIHQKKKNHSWLFYQKKKIPAQICRLNQKKK